MHLLTGWGNSCSVDFGCRFRILYKYFFFFLSTGILYVSAGPCDKSKCCYQTGSEQYLAMETGDELNSSAIRLQLTCFLEPCFYSSYLPVAFLGLTQKDIETLVISRE